MGNLILNTLEIRNFRAFELLRIEQLGRVNLITGKNNVGKTCLLEALQLYARKSSLPASIWKIVTARDKAKRRLVNTGDILAALRYLFHGRQEMRAHVKPIQISPIDSPEEMLSIAIDWPIAKTKNGSLHTHPLLPGEEYTTEHHLPRFIIQTEGSLFSYPLNPSFSQQIFRPSAKEMNCIFIPANGLREEQIIELWDGIALTNLEQEILAALRLIAPGVEGLNFVGSPTLDPGEREAIVKIANVNEPFPLSNLGDGMQRILGISLALANAKDGMLLIDEFENGLHYSVQADLWHLIFHIANRLNVQVFATTHNWNCIEAFQKAMQEAPQSNGFLIRLENKKGNSVSTLFDNRKLGIAARERIEVR